MSFLFIFNLCFWFIFKCMFWFALKCEFFRFIFISMFMYMYIFMQIFGLCLYVYILYPKAFNIVFYINECSDNISISILVSYFELNRTNIMGIFFFKNCFHIFHYYNNIKSYDSLSWVWNSFHHFIQIITIFIFIYLSSWHHNNNINLVLWNTAIISFVCIVINCTRKKHKDRSITFQEHVIFFSFKHVSKFANTSTSLWISVYTCISCKPNATYA